MEELSATPATELTAVDDVVAAAARVAADVLRGNADEVDRTGRWPETSLRALQHAGLGGMVAPRDVGGLGHGLLAIAGVCETLGRECASSAICFGMHCVGTAVIAAKATQHQRAQYLAPIARGEHLTTLALSEPGTGAHFYLPQTQLHAGDGGTFRVEGAKTFVTNGSHADSYVISAAAARADAPPGEFSCLILDAETTGLVWSDRWDGLGMRGNDSRGLRIESADVPQENLLGEEGDELWYVFNVIAPFFLMAMAGTYLGVAAAAIDEARDHLQRRSYSATGSGPAHSPVVQHRLGSAWAVVERARRLTFDAAARGDAGAPDALPAILSAKAEVAESAVHATNEAMTLVGGVGYGANTRLGRLLRDARASHVMAPTTDMLRTWTGRVLLGQPLLVD